MKIGVVGNGVVGNAVARGFMEHAEVRCFDIDTCKRTHSLEETVSGADWVFVCLPSPRLKSGGGLDLSVLNEFFASVAGSDRRFVLKSTVPPGTTEEFERDHALRIVHSPEFLTARCAVTDFQIPARNIVGVPPEASIRDDIGEELADYYRQRFPGAPCYMMTSHESELVKLICNSFFAVKIAFFNEARDAVDVLKCDWNAVMRGVLSDGRIAHSHTNVPGPDGYRGFGGTCLPKDLAAMDAVLATCDIPAGVCQGAEEVNKRHRQG